MTFDLNFRPKSYFDDLTLEQKLQSKITGQLRSEMVVRNVRQGSVPSELLKSKLSEPIKNAQGGIHPWMMGGEYLPDLYPNEVELCRVVLKSTTMDVASFRVRKQKYRLVYRIVDEYGNKFILMQRTSVEPLSMGQVVEILDTSRMIFYDTGEELDEVGLIKPHIIYYKEYGDEREEVIDFVTVTSPFYPDLENYYENQKEVWFDDLP